MRGTHQTTAPTNPFPIYGHFYPTALVPPAPSPSPIVFISSFVPVAVLGVLVSQFIGKPKRNDN